MDFDLFYFQHKFSLREFLSSENGYDLPVLIKYNIPFIHIKEIRTILFTYFAFYKNLFYNLYKIIIYEFGRIKVHL